MRGRINWWRVALNFDPLNQSPLGSVDGGTRMTSDVQLDAVVYDLSGEIVSNGPEHSLDRSGPELLHCAAVDADIMMMVMPDAGDAVHGSAVHGGNLADCPHVKQELDGAIYGCPADRRQLLDDGLDFEAVILLLEEVGYGFPGGSAPIAEVLELGQQVWG